MSAVAKKTEFIAAQDLARAFTYATDWLAVYKDEVNALNVYPVPDGDTGTNMYLTMQSVRRELSQEAPKTMEKFSHAIAYGSLLGARGNSGVILSQILKGFSEELKGLKELDAKSLIKALQTATKSAYAAVMTPVEGTILTVVRLAADGAEEKASSSPLQVFKDALKAGNEALAKTPEMLPILKQAGVVDSGGLGYIRILEGIVAFFEGKDLPAPPKIKIIAQEMFEEEEFGFCTEFLLSDVIAPTAEIKELVKPFGDSLLVVGAEGFVKGHIHTEEPEKLLAAVARFGNMVRSKVEDMSEQHSEILSDIDITDAKQANVGLVVVSDGYGVTKVFRNLKARVVGGGQTNNPSVQDIADAVKSVGAQNVIIMPNNKNIIMAADRVVELMEDKNVKVVPTRTLGQGLAAAVLFDEAGDFTDLIDSMQEAADESVTIEVTTASRTAVIEDVDVTEGQFIGLVDGKLKVSVETPEKALNEMLNPIVEDYEIGTLFYNAAVGPDKAEELKEQLEEKYEDLEIELHAGAPDLYPYLLVLE